MPEASGVQAARNRGRVITGAVRPAPALGIAWKMGWSRGETVNVSVSGAKWPALQLRKASVADATQRVRASQDEKVNVPVSVAALPRLAVRKAVQRAGEPVLKSDEIERRVMQRVVQQLAQPGTTRETVARVLADAAVTPRLLQTMTERVIAVIEKRNATERYRLARH